MQHVFLSFKHEDQDFADNVIAECERDALTQPPKPLIPAAAKVLETGGVG